MHSRSGNWERLRLAHQERRWLRSRTRKKAVMELLSTYVSLTLSLVLSSVKCVPLQAWKANRAQINGSVGPKDGNEALNRSPNSHTTAGQASENVDESRYTLHPALPEAAVPAFPAAVKSGGDTGVRVEALAGECGSLLDGPRKIQHAWKAVREVDHEQSTDQADNSAEIGNGGSDDEGEDPVARAQTVPGDPALRGADWGKVEDLLEDFKVDRLHSDVEPGVRDLQQAIKPVNNVNILPAVCNPYEGVDEDTEQQQGKRQRAERQRTSLFRVMIGSIVLINVDLVTAG
ncbi:hypothetical protein KC337_g76 [Hortaea werneckii]|nr:hypothetical protein KC337_g76 [Hortaea werneckii]